MAEQEIQKQNPGPEDNGRATGKNFPGKNFRVPFGLPYDPTIALVAAGAGLPRAQVVGLWVTLLDYASRNHPAGSIAGLDLRAAAALLDVDARKFRRALALLRTQGAILRDDRLRGWQGGYVRTSTERVRAWRERQAQQNDIDSAAAIAARHQRLRAQAQSGGRRAPAAMAEGVRP